MLEKENLHTVTGRSISRVQILESEWLFEGDLRCRATVCNWISDLTVNQKGGIVGCTNHQ